VYTGDVLPNGMELTGTMRAIINVSSDALDTDVTLKLVDVFPDGRAMNIVEGITRVRYRNSYGRPEMMKPNTVYEVPVDLHATSWFLAPGHRLRVEVSSSNFPRFDRNLNTGGKNYDETTWKVAKNSVHHTAARPSRLILPVVK
jgi:putative CocE/NonD family hydrolase